MISSVQRGDLLELSQVEAKGFGGGNESSKQRHRNALEQTEESAVMQDSIPNNLARMRSKTKLLKLSFFRFSLPLRRSLDVPTLPSFLPSLCHSLRTLTIYSTRLSPPFQSSKAFPNSKIAIMFFLVRLPLPSPFSFIPP